MPVNEWLYVGSEVESGSSQRMQVLAATSANETDSGGNDGHYDS